MNEAANLDDATICEILGFWFGDAPDDGEVARLKAPLWWGKNADTDVEVQRRFGHLVKQAAEGKLRRWQETPRGLLALIILCDQLTRMIHRDTPHAFAFDPLARQWCEQGLARGVDRALRPIERVFFYLPLEHSEALAHQACAVELFTGLSEQVPEAHREAFDLYLDYAIRHRDIIARFGRFPHRNQILDRASTQVELDFLEGPGSAF